MEPTQLDLEIMAGFEVPQIVTEDSDYLEASDAFPGREATCVDCQKVGVGGAYGMHGRVCWGCLGIEAIF